MLNPCLGIPGNTPADLQKMQLFFLLFLFYFEKNKNYTVGIHLDLFFDFFLPRFLSPYFKGRRWKHYMAMHYSIRSNRLLYYFGYVVWTLGL